MSIRILPAHVAARIAAGEVVERPASVVKELVENALDSGASRIEISVRGDKLVTVIVTDDGRGMGPDDLGLALCRHATSKLVDDDILKVSTLGYRGEALPSMAAVATVRITSRPKGQDVAFSIASVSGKASQPRPSAGKPGTRVEVSELFESHPARLKFMKSRRTEAAAVREVIADLALSRHDVEFRFDVMGTEGSFAARSTLSARASDVIGQDFAKDAFEVMHVEEGIAVRGLACIPAASRTDASGLRFCVNGRPVADRLLRGAVQSAYSALIGPGRHPRVFLSVEVPPHNVDVNVHPRKSEVRFFRPSDVAGAVTRAIEKAFAQSGLRSPSAIGDLARLMSMASTIDAGDRRRLPLGRFLGQANGSWIVSETADGIVIIDQHAAHERVIMERLRQSALFSEGVTRYPQPRRSEVSPSEAAAVHDSLETIGQMGFSMRAGDSHVELLSVPSALGDCDPDELCSMIVRCASDGSEAGLIGQALWEKLATAACKAAIKAGQSLTPERADALLREIEATPNAAQCNHGRPTVAFLSGGDIARLFARG